MSFDDFSLTFQELQGSKMNNTPNTPATEMDADGIAELFDFNTSSFGFENEEKLIKNLDSKDIGLNDTATKNDDISKNDLNSTNPLAFELENEFFGISVESPSLKNHLNEELEDLAAITNNKLHLAESYFVESFSSDMGSFNVFFNAPYLNEKTKKLTYMFLSLQEKEIFDSKFKTSLLQLFTEETVTKSEAKENNARQTSLMMEKKGFDYFQNILNFEEPRKESTALNNQDKHIIGKESKYRSSKTAKAAENTENNCTDSKVILYSTQKDRLTSQKRHADTRFLVKNSNQELLNHENSMKIEHQVQQQGGKPACHNFLINPTIPFCNMQQNIQQALMPYPVVPIIQQAAPYNGKRKHNGTPTGYYKKTKITNSHQTALPPGTVFTIQLPNDQIVQAFPAQSQSYPSYITPQPFHQLQPFMPTYFPGLTNGLDYIVSNENDFRNLQNSGNSLKNNKMFGAGYNFLNNSGIDKPHVSFQQPLISPIYSSVTSVPTPMQMNFAGSVPYQRMGYYSNTAAPQFGALKNINTSYPANIEPDLPVSSLSRSYAQSINSSRSSSYSSPSRDLNFKPEEYFKDKNSQDISQKITSILNQQKKQKAHQFDFEQYLS